MAKAHWQRNEHDISSTFRTVAEEMDNLRAENEQLRRDADRYTWLIAHMGRVESYVLARPATANTPLLVYVQEFIDAEMQKENSEWFIKQRALLNMERGE